jgi:hypothetical protein
MSVLADTSVVSLVLRRRKRPSPETPHALALRRLLDEDEPVAIAGITLQEVLSGIRDAAVFAKIEELLQSMPVLVATTDHHVLAARIFNACVSKGVAPSAVDCLIAATAVGHDAELLTTDDDFARMAPHCGLRLFQP